MTKTDELESGSGTFDKRIDLDSYINSNSSLKPQKNLNELYYDNENFSINMKAFNCFTFLHIT